MSPSSDLAEPSSPGAGDLLEVVLHRVSLPLREPFVAAHGTEFERTVVLVEAVGADGSAGWGECSALSRPTYSAEHTDSAWADLRDRLVPAVLAGSGVRARLGGSAAGPAGAPMAWTALSTALTDLRLRRRGRSLATAIGGRRAEVALTAVIGQRRDVDDLLAVVDRRVGEGYGSVKLKIAPGADVELLRAVRRHAPGLGLAADANGSYRLDDEDHRDRLRAIDGLGLDYLEQPLPAGAVDDLARLAGELATPVALDEAVGGPADAERLARTGAAFVLNLKPARVGGLDESLRCLAVAVDAGWPAFIGGMLETGVGRALALAAASWEACTLPTDLGPSSRYFDDDVTEPIELLAGSGGPDAGARLAVPRGPGLGVTPRPGRLAEVTVDRAVLRP
jgi:O-succinylbenzoate synthase